MKKEVFKAWTLVLQIGISVLVPIFLLIAIGYLLKNYFQIDAMLICIILGVLRGVRNAYALIRNYINSIPKKSKNESELLDKHLKSM